MSFYNTDISGYHKEFLVDGFPSHSLKIREFVPFLGEQPSYSPDSVENYRNHVIQQPWYRIQMNRKREILSGPKGMENYHRSILNYKTEEDLVGIIRPHLSKRLNQWYNPEMQNLYGILSNVPVDLVVCQNISEEEPAKITFCHLAFPNGWSANDAIGKDFSYFHSDVKVGNTEKRNLVPSNPKFAQMFMKENKCFERVGAFSIQPATNYDRHNHKDPEKIKKVFTYGGNLFLRFERQVIMGAPEINGFLFFIHTHFVDMKTDPEFFMNAIKKAHPNCNPIVDIEKYKIPLLIELNRMKNEKQMVSV